MKRFSLQKIAVSLFLSLTLLLVGCTSAFHTSDADARFEQYTDLLWEQEVCSNTITLHYTLEHPESYGITSAPVTCGSFSSDSDLLLAGLENCQAALAGISCSDLSEENQITYDILSYYFQTEKEGAPYLLYNEPLSPITGIHAQLPVLLAEYQFRDVDDVETYLELLGTVPDYFDSLCAFEREKSDAGLFFSDATADSVLEQCEAFLRMGDDNYLLSTFEERLGDLDLSADARAQYISENQDCLQKFVFPAYETLIATVTELKGSGKNDLGLCYFPEGRAYYTYLVKSDTGSSKSIAELKECIYGQIASDLLAMNEILSTHAELTSETGVTLTDSPEVLLASLRTGTESAFPESPSVSVEIKYVPEALEPYLSPAFYMIPSIDNTRSNVIYLNQGRNMDGLELFTTLAHEGYPGHLYQTTYFAGKHAAPIRSLLNFDGYVEGWATYAEMCSYSLAPIDRTRASLLQKNSSAILGLYAAADIGIHYDGWTREEMQAFFCNYGINEENTLNAIYDLIVGDPANYLKYYVGYLEFLELKQEAMQREGGEFSQKEFHRRVLDVGPAPFDVVSKYAGSP